MSNAMASRDVTAALILSLALQVLGLASACTPHSSATLAKSVESFHPGDRVAALPPSQADHISLLKNDPSNGDHWTLELARAHPDAAPRFQWEFASAQVPLSDRRADGNLVNHLLDSLEE